MGQRPRARTAAGRATASRHRGPTRGAAAAARHHKIRVQNIISLRPVVLFGLTEARTSQSSPSFPPIAHDAHAAEHHLAAAVAIEIEITEEKAPPAGKLHRI